MKKLSLFIIFVSVCISLLAVPSNRRPFVVKQSDGTSLTVILKGDEALRFYTTLDGKYLVKENNGDYCYATLSESGLVSTNFLAHNKNERRSEEEALIESINTEDIKASLSKSHAKRSATYRSAAKKAGSSIKPSGDVLVPVLLVEYSDVKFSFKKEYIDRLLNEPGFMYDNPLSETYGSARDYFIAQSDSLFRPRFVTTDIITLTKPMAYYGENDMLGNDNNPALMIKEAISKADASFDFSQFDNNGDGEVEFVYCIYAGYSEANGASENTIWPHQWEISADLGTPATADGVKCNVYACSSELTLTEEYENMYGKYLSGIGTICHEFSHCLGLYDIYDVTGESGNWGMDEWDIMDYGNHVGYGYLPVGYNSYQKDVCGWKKLEVLTEKGSYSMKPMTQGGIGYKIVNDANPNEYFILENRKREGWDQGLSNDGMMIIHVDYNYSAWISNSINTVAGHPRFQIVPADNELLEYTGDEEAFRNNISGDLWPGKNGNTKFTDTSIPAAKLYTGGYLNKPVTDIKYENYIASFKFMGGIVNAPTIKSASDITGNSFVANWTVVDDAVDYIVELYRSEVISDGNGSSEEILSEDFFGCSKTNTEITQKNIDDYTSVAGWQGENIYSEGGVIRVGTSNNPGTLYTPVFHANGNATVSFDTWRYNASDTGAKLTAEILDKNGYAIASTLIETTWGSSRVELSAEVNGSFKVCFNTSKSSGKKRAKIDNVLVSVCSTSKNELIESVTAEDNKYKFENLDAGTYKYRVKARDNEDESSFSEFAEVVIEPTTAIHPITHETAAAEIFNISGIKIATIGNGIMPKLQRGFYIIRQGTQVKKIFVK